MSKKITISKRMIRNNYFQWLKVNILNRIKQFKDLSGEICMIKLILYKINATNLKFSLISPYKNINVIPDRINGK